MFYLTTLTLNFGFLTHNWSISGCSFSLSVSHPVGDHLREKPCAIFPVNLSGKAHTVIRSCWGQPTSSHIMCSSPSHLSSLCWTGCSQTGQCVSSVASPVLHTELDIWIMQPCRCWNPMRNFFCPPGCPGPFLLGCFQASWFSACSVLWGLSVPHPGLCPCLCWPAQGSPWPAPAAWPACSDWWLLCINALPACPGDQPKTCWGCTLYHLCGDLIKQDLP